MLKLGSKIFAHGMKNAAIFFEASQGNVSASIDGNPREFGTVDEAQSHAMTLLPLAAGVQVPMKAGEFRSWTVLVRDESGIVVCRLIMAIINDDLHEGAARVLRPVVNEDQP